MSTTNWNLADILETVATTQPDAPAQVQGERRLSWRDLDRRANALAARLQAAGLGRHAPGPEGQSKLALYLYNAPEYLEGCLAAFKAAVVPVNTNFRYGPEELAYLWDNADAEAVVFHTSFNATVAALRERLPRVKLWLAVDDGPGIPDWAEDYEAIAAPGADRVAGERSGDDLLFLYTGGTTGMPKGVMWRQDDLFNVLGAGGNAAMEIPGIESLDDLAGRLRANGPGMTYMPACPLMHGTGWFGALIAMHTGGCIVTLEGRGLDVQELWDTVQREGVNSVSIVGDAFARPMLKALDAEPQRWDLSSMLMMGSSGVMWSQETKQGLLRHMPQIVIADSFGSSEAVGLGGSRSTAGAAEQTARFEPGEAVGIFVPDEDWRRAGPGERGMIAVSGFIPLGYYKDQAKTASTFRIIEGVRWSIPGDFAEVHPDGTITLLGRGSVCINTGGEKVFPEEVEEVLKRHPAIHDAVCVGIPNERFGQTICAVLEAAPGADLPDIDSVAAHVKASLAGYKAPRHVVAVDSIGRAPNGKVDYKRLTALAHRELGVA